MNTKVVAYSNKKLDGFGSVYLCCMNAFATARYDKQLYYHTNFNDLNGKSLHHNYNNDKNYSSIWDEKGVVKIIDQTKLPFEFRVIEFRVTQ